MVKLELEEGEELRFDRWSPKGEKPEGLLWKIKDWEAVGVLKVPTGKDFIKPPADITWGEVLDSDPISLEEAQKVLSETGQLSK